jgi:ribonuclease BN (tRNA processing enzyme)
MVTVQFLGSGDAFGSGGRYQPCIHLRGEGTSLLLDCGASSLIAMKRFGTAPNDIDAIVVSHLHGDHFGGIPFFALDAQLVSRRERPLVIAGPPGIEERVTQAMEVLFPGSTGVQRKFEMRFMELADWAPVEIAGATVTAFEVVHASGAPAYALRVRAGGRTIAYSGDTEWTEALTEAARGAALFICEAYYFEKKMKFHLDYATLMQHREELDCKRIIVTHMSADMLGRMGELGVEAAADGMLVEL